MQRGGAASWPALAATAALHVAVIAALALGVARAPDIGTPQLVTIPLQATDKAPAPQRPSPVVPVRMAAPRSPRALAPAIAIAAAPASPTPIHPAATVTAPPPRAAAKPASPDDALRRYAALLYARIAAHRRVGLHRRGTVVLRFTLDSGGALVGAAIAQSSGDALLDAAALMSLRAAAPFPPPPPALAKAALGFSIPFEFS